MEVSRRRGGAASRRPCRPRAPGAGRRSSPSWCTRRRRRRSGSWRPRAGCSRCARRSGSRCRWAPRRAGGRWWADRRRGTARSRRGCPSPMLYAVPWTMEPADGLQLHLGEAEVRRPVRHHRVLPGQLRRVEEGEVHRPLPARAAGGELEPGPAVALADVAGEVRRGGSGTGTPELLGVAQVAEPVGHRLVGGAEHLAQQLHVVAGALHLAEEVAVAEEQRTGEVVGQVHLDELRRLGVAGPGAAEDGLEEPVPVHHQQADRRGELELERLLGERRARG